MMKRLLFTIVLIIATVGFIQAQNGSISGGSPLQAITTVSALPTTNTPTTADGTDFGTVPQGTTASQTYRFTSAVGDVLSITAANLSGDWVQQAASPFSISGVNSTSDFTVDFTPTTTGTQTATVRLDVFNNSTFLTESFYFQITGEGGAPASIIEIRGDDNIVVTTTVTPGDNTDFGNVTLGNTNTRLYTVKNIGSADLDVTSIFIPGGPTDFSIILPVALPNTLAPNTSFSFQVKFAPTAAATRNATIAIANSDANFAFQVSGVGVVASSNMDVTGNGTSIANGSTAVSSGDGTLFPDTDITGSGVDHTFTIKNNGTVDLDLTNIPLVNITGADAADFTVTAAPATPITSGGGTTTFTITFDPSTSGVKNATVSIANNSVDDPYTFAIQGKGVDGVPVGSELLITQYYEGVNNNKWIEVKNISSNTIISGVYNLCLYANTNTRTGVIDVIAPDASIAISGSGAGGAILPGEVIVFKNPGSTLPSAANLGGGLQIPTNVCTFDGDDIILISTSVGTSCYNDRIDIMGVVAQPLGTPPVWGENIGFIKGCGTSQLPTKSFKFFDGINGFLVTDYIKLTIEEVDAAESTSNVALGSQNSGATVWSGASWSNGFSDRTRNATINATYTAANGSFGACDLVVNGSLNFDNGTSNYIEVSRSLNIVGSLSLGDQESLYTVNASDSGNTVSITGSISKSEKTTSLTNKDDYTYWSSPVQSANISNVFASGTYSQSSLYYWDMSAVNVDGTGGNQALGEWIPAAGQTMKSGKGYISQGPVSGNYPLQATVTFSGAPNNGTITLTAGNDVVFNNNLNGLDDLSLIGNPYPSVLDANKFILDSDNSASLNGTLWFWTHATPNNQDPDTANEQYSANDYASYNLSGGTAAVAGSPIPTRYIGSAQGFIVQTNSTVEKVTFTDGMRVKGLNTQFFKSEDTKKSASEEEDRVWLNIESSVGRASNQILVGFFDNATDGFDRAYDGENITAGWVSIYSRIDDKKYAIQGLGSFTTDKKVPLGFDTYIDDASVTYKISIDHLEGALKDNDLYLVDNELNITHDLKQEAYSFAVTSEGNYAERFTLQFTNSVLAVDDLELNNNFVVVNEDDNLLIKSNTIINQIKVYDITGRLLIDTNPNESTFRINTSSIKKGTVLILNTTFENGSEISKKAIKY